MATVFCLVISAVAAFPNGRGVKNERERAREIGGGRDRDREIEIEIEIDRE